VEAIMKTTFWKIWAVGVAGLAVASDVDDSHAKTVDVGVVDVVSMEEEVVEVVPVEDRWRDTAPSWPGDYRGAFLERLAPHAIRSGRDHCVPPSVVMAQAVQESGWGRSGLARSHGNLFGIKSWSDKGVELATTEGAGIATRASFRRWTDWTESVEVHGRLLSSDPRYAHANAHRADAEAYVKAIAPVYASDPAYADKLVKIMRRYELTTWDAQVSDASSCEV
jgi:flagellum-specific peptidoglycan hydrolase FlgJ